MIKLKPIFYALAATAAVAAISISSPNVNSKLRSRENPAYLEDIACESSKFNSAITNLFESPSGANAARAQRQSMISFAEIFLYGDDMPQPTANALLSNYISQANLCLRGFKQVPNNIYVNHYTEQVNWRKSLAKRLIVFGWDVQELEPHIYKELRVMKKNK